MLAFAFGVQIDPNIEASFRSAASPDIIWRYNSQESLFYERFSKRECLQFLEKNEQMKGKCASLDGYPGAGVFQERAHCLSSLIKLENQG